MYNIDGSINCVTLMRLMGPINTPAFVLEQVKKAIFGSEINLAKMFKQGVPVDDFVE